MSQLKPTFWDDVEVLDELYPGCLRVAVPFVNKLIIAVVDLDETIPEADGEQTTIRARGDVGTLILPMAVAQRLGLME